MTVFKLMHNAVSKKLFGKAQCTLFVCNLLYLIEDVLRQTRFSTKWVTRFSNLKLLPFGKNITLTTHIIQSL